MKPEGESETFLPDSDEFRAWLRVARLRLGIKPSTLSVAAGVATNTLGKFEDERVKSREIHLSTAAKIYRTALRMAQEARMKAVSWASRVGRSATGTELRPQEAGEGAEVPTWTPFRRELARTT